MDNSEEIAQRFVEEFWELKTHSKNRIREMLIPYFEEHSAPLRERIRELEDKLAHANSYPTWISVDERLPDENDVVIVCAEYGVERSTAEYFYDEGRWHPIDGYYSSEIINVTHWMPLPPAPSQETKSSPEERTKQ